jgi:hypothetical protein
MEDIIPLTVGVIVALLIVLLTIYYFIKRRPKTNILLVGLSDAGKTFIFTKFVSKGKQIFGFNEPFLF